MVTPYEHSRIERRWLASWVQDSVWAAPRTPDPSKKRYTLTMYPYPSGDMHMGHVEVFSIHDTIARFYRMQGYEVLNPIGFDAFGLPAENAAIKRGIDPRAWTYENIERLYSSAQRLGCSFDWDRTIRTCDPEYYRWNQWFFLRFFERGLAYRNTAPVNWCPTDKTVLANEQVIAGRCERCDTPVVKRNLAQWFFKITDYADELLDCIDENPGWSERLRTLQRNWIGRSQGVEVTFELEGTDESLVVYTTKPETLWGVTFMVLAPEHPLVDDLVAPERKDALAELRTEVGRLTEIDRTMAERPKKALFLGTYATNPVNGERVPVWTADYVLMDYGTGAIMGVPAHDQRDFDFARQYELPIRVVIAPEGHPVDTEPERALPAEGAMLNSGHFDGTPSSGAAQAVTSWLEEKGLGRSATHYHLRDWLVSRQRYWGTPIPIIHCPSCGPVGVPDDELPVELPDDVDFTPTEAAAPLATAEEWVNTDCPKCGGSARRDTDTMDTFVDSSWYFHRYTDPFNDKMPFEREKSDAWMPIDIYTGGLEHAVLHLLYARFWQKVMADMGLVRDREPYPRMLNQGDVTMGGKRMSKSRGNLVDPQEALERYGADALRLFMLFSGPPQANFDWPDEGVSAIGRVTSPWLERVWRLCEDTQSLGGEVSPEGDAEIHLRRAIHRTTKVVTADYEASSFNTAIARLMELVNAAYKYRSDGGAHSGVLRELIDTLLRLLAPMAPYLTEEQWHRLGNESSVHFADWPTFDPDMAVEEEVTMIVMIDGKVRDTIAVHPDISEERMKELAFSSERALAHTAEKNVDRVVVRRPKIVNIVTS